ncbi:MAG: polysaccharide deacetylase family protein [Myxococcota bacterium]|nr:polysaccharide deacetylase family protein [Myxococcota bacterium]
MMTTILCLVTSAGAKSPPQPFFMTAAGGDGTALPFKGCLTGQSSKQAQCITDAIRFGQSSLVRDVRQLLRNSDDPAVVEAAAVALVNWGDRYSHSLLIKSLWEGKGGDRGVLALAWASRQLRRFHTHSLDMRRIAALVHEKPWRRAAIKSSLKTKKWRKLTVADANELIIELKTFVHIERPSRAQLRRAQVALHALRQSKRGKCRTIWQMLDMDDPIAIERLAQIVGVLPRSCVSKAEGYLRASNFKVLRKLRGKRRARHYLKVRPLACKQAPRVACDRLADPYAAHFETGRTHAKTGYRYNPIRSGSLPHSAFVFRPQLKQPDWFPPSVEITIDDGLYTRSANKFLDTLDDYGVKASFFWCGGSVAMSAARNLAAAKAVVRRVIDGGHLIAYHSMSHGTGVKAHLINWEPDQVIDDIDAFRWIINWMAEETVEIKYGRLPGGDGTGFADIQLTFARAGLAPPVLWHQHSLAAWTRSHGMRQSLGKRLRQRCKSYIVLLHEYGSSLSEMRSFIRGLYETRETPSCQTIVNDFPLQDMVRSEWGYALDKRVEKVMRRRKREGRTGLRGTRSHVGSMKPFERQFGFRLPDQLR